MLIRVLGPTNFTTNDTAGMLVDGYDRPPTVMMTYNKPYYNDFVTTNMDLTKEMDIFAYYIPTEGVNEKSLAIASMLQERLDQERV